MARRAGTGKAKAVVDFDEEKENQADEAGDDNEKRRYNLVLPKKQLRALQARADSRGITLVELMRKYIRIGTLVEDTEDAGGEVIVREEGGKEKTILLY